MKHKILITACLFLLGLLLAQQGFSQCEDGFKTHVNQSIGSGTLISNHYRSEAIVGQTFISEPVYSYDNASATGYWSMMYNPPQVTAVAASDGQFLDRIMVTWKINKNTPPVTQGFNIYRDGYLIGSTQSNVFTYNDYNITPGVYYTYEITGSNSNGEGAKASDVGYVNPNGVISGRVTTFSGNSVESAIVSIMPSNNLSVKFDGSSGIYIDTVTTNPNPLVTDVFTFSMWAKVSSFGSEGMLFDYGKDDEVNFWLGVENDSSIYVAMADLSGTKKVSYQLTEKYNLWHHIAAVYNGRDLVLFFDGVVVGTTTLNSSNTKYANHKISIGASGDVNASNNRFNGYIDDIRLFNRVQRPSEIKKFMHYTVPKSYNGLVAYWKMDEGKGTSVINQVETARSGMLCGAEFSTTEPGVKSAGISNASGYYLIEDVNYGNGTNFTVTPEKFVSYNTALEFNDIESNYAVTSAFEVKDSATIELWFNPYHYNGTQYILSANGTTPFDIYLEGNILKLSINGQAQTIGTLSGLDYKYLTIVRARENVTVYLNGEVGTAQNVSFSYNSFVARTTWNLGRSTAGNNYYSGLIDAIIVWNEALSIPDIQLHNSLGLQDRMIEINGLMSVDERITAFIHLNDQTGNEIVNDVPYNGVLEYGSIYGAEFVDIVAHEYGVEHGFNPNSRIVTLNNSNTSSNGIDFTDITTVPVSGVVKYENTNCFISYAEIKVNGLSTSPPTYTDSEGKWTVDLEPGATAQLSVYYNNHEMFPAPYFEVKNVQSPKAGILFVDKEKRSVSGVLAGGTCEFNIIPDGGTATITLSSLDGCFEMNQILNPGANSASYVFENIPPVEYNITLSQHTLSFVKDFFDDLGGEEIDLTSANVENLDFIYRSAHNVEVSPLETNGCGETILNYGVPKTVVVKVYEDYLGEKCYLETADLTIDDGIGFSTNPDFSGIDVMNNGFYEYSFYPGEANIVYPYLKSTQVIADVDGSTATQSFSAVVVGQRKRTNTYTTVTPQLPMMILRDPPGDNSYAWLQKDSSFCTSNVQFETTTDEWEAGLSLFAGPDYTVSFGLGAQTEHTLDWTVDLNYSHSESSSGTLNTETEVCFTSSENISTSADGLIGEEGDIYVGAAMNLIYGLADNLYFDEDSCIYKIYQTQVIDINGFNTVYMYSQYHLINDVIPSNLLIGDTAAARAWQNMIELNDSLKNEATLIENRSFDAGVTYENSTTESRSDVLTTEFEIDLSDGGGANFGVTLDGIGFQINGAYTFSYTSGGSNSNSVSTGTSTGYVLADDDIGDNFTLDILKDKTFGSPVFKLKAGESSCPHEPNTLPREGVQVMVDNAEESTKINVPADQAAIYALYLGNTSESDETMTYAVNLVNNSNPFGAALSINGAPLVATQGGSGFTYTLDPLVGQYVTLALERGPNPDIFDYEGIQVVFQSLCDEQIGDTVTVNAHFVEPCSNVKISSPQNGWVLTPIDNGLLNIVIDSYDEADSDLELIRVQYRQTGAPSWVNISEIQTVDLGALFTSVEWNIGTLTDGNYEIRALSQCTGGIPSSYSEVITGMIEQSPPEIYGIPQPADGIYQAGDEISVTFTENINCNLVFYADQSNLNNVGLYDLTINELIPADIQCIGNKITILPQIPDQYIENHTLEVRITQIEDLVGNTLEEDITGSLIHKWDFYVNTSPIAWVGAAVDEVMYSGNGHSFTRTIANSGGYNVNYTIETPSYVTASSTSGILPPGGEKTINFTIDSQIANGEYTGELVLSNTAYGNEVLPFQLRVMCQPPDWSFSASQYSFNMNFTVALDVVGFLSEDEFDLIAAFIDNEIRGVANVQYVDALGKYLAFLSVYGETADDGKEITFKVWDASECKLYEYTQETFNFSANENIGTPLNEETIHTLDILAQTIYLNAGWNWVSFNLELDNDSCANVLSGLAYPENGLIRSQTNYSQYYPTLNSWVGSLDTINEIEMYQIKLNASQELDFFGRPIDVESTVIPINIGWNWIAYLPQGGMPTNDALESLTPYNGDIVKNQYLFAQYVTGYGWLGNLSYMNPPSGFLYKSSVNDNLVYPTAAYGSKSMSTDKQLKDNILSEFENANISPNQFSGNMSVVGAVYSLEDKIAKQGDRIYAYINGSLRGFSESFEFEGEYIFFLTVFGNDTDHDSEISFTYYNAEDETLYNVLETLSYSENDVTGLVREEQPLTLSSQVITGFENTKPYTMNLVSLYPNPVTDVSILSFYSREGGVAEVSVYDNIGKCIAKKELQTLSGINKVDFNEILGTSKSVQGLYYVTVLVDNNSHSIKAIVK